MEALQIGPVRFELHQQESDQDEQRDPRQEARRHHAGGADRPSGRRPPRALLLRVETRAGHGAGKPTTKQIDEQADLYAFLFRALDVPYHPVA